MFGIGGREMIILLVIVLIIFGPTQLPRLAQSLGRSARELKKGLEGINDEIRESMNEPGNTRGKPNDARTHTTDAQPADNSNESPKSV